MLKKIFLIVCSLFALQSYCSEGQSPKKPQLGYDKNKYGSLMFGEDGEMVAIATVEQAEAASALSQRLWAMSCENLTCTNCPRCVGKAKARSTNKDEKGRLNNRLLAFLSQAISHISSGK